MRLIDADALFKDICDSINEMTKIGLMVDGDWLWGKLNDALENAPTIEPKRGTWYERYSHEDGERDGVRCSECGTYYYFGGQLMNYCPNCGADMREGETE